MARSPPRSRCTASVALRRQAIACFYLDWSLAQSRECMRARVYCNPKYSLRHAIGSPVARGHGGLLCDARRLPHKHHCAPVPSVLIGRALSAFHDQPGVLRAFEVDKWYCLSDGCLIDRVRATLPAPLIAIVATCTAYCTCGRCTAAHASMLFSASTKCTSIDRWQMSAPSAATVGQRKACTRRLGSSSTVLTRSDLLNRQSRDELSRCDDAMPITAYRSAFYLPT